MPLAKFSADGFTTESCSVRLGFPARIWEERSPAIEPPVVGSTSGHSRERLQNVRCPKRDQADADNTALRQYESAADTAFPMRQDDH